MRYKQFRIQNYKGIKDLTLDLDLHPDNKIYTLVGLNESGKTTILEAINDFEFEVPAAERHLLIPKSAAGGFTGTISIEARLMLSNEDKTHLTAFVQKRVGAKEVFLPDEFSMKREYKFDNSTPTDTRKTYTLSVQIKKTAKGKLQYLESGEKDNVWTEIKPGLFPEIIYYRDFLSKFPEKIYLTPSNEPKEREYFSIVEDVLTSINSSYTIQGSLLERLSNPSDANQQALEAVENQVSAKISSVVFDAWSKIQKVSKKEIVAKTGQDPSDGRFYIRLSVKEANETYAISERSLGFRWFFTFLLYTEFRKERIKTSGEILFLLDEPASNLHQTAQKSLLDTFKTITSKSRLIYTTHSHHLINPEWLSSAYIIKNKGLTYSPEDDFDSSKTEVEAYKYKQFVAAYPKETSYFQPILDVLDYQPGLLELIPRIILTEGKFDYFTFKYFKEIVFHNTADYSFYPGHGATALDLPIGLYESWGREYLVLLDADKEGRDQKKRYIKELSSEHRIFTLEDADSVNKNLTTEKLFTEDEKISISREFNSALAAYDKSAFNTGIQILLNEGRVPAYLRETTKDRLKIVLEFLESKF